ncbi:adenine deaminase C-terminal domain-containing protein [Bacillus marinisedimentorum]|uniref:adenine deaminase C-terminal domain-containing protein n=1 Tax=Bacillus marinisedimentorum TaxID=1821260 RepID=UPI000872512F|nr:adenine deaminase C-terminal domain-containing protein [Bacillus marinisedimentorum]
MPHQRYHWKNKEIREQIAVVNGKKSPDLILKNATYLNSVLKKWMTANIWIYADRIVYVGEKLPENSGAAEIADLSGSYVVPGYIEPHSHPFQLYNPLTLAHYSSLKGTTTLINDNLVLALQLPEKKAFTFIEDVQKKLPASLYWWCRYDSQTELRDEDELFSNGRIKAWLEHECVLQGGELTAWPRVLQGDDLMLHWMQETKRLRKPIEGHLPGASEKTLVNMKLLGVDCDHEAMTGEDVLKRLSLGYTAPLRHSSIRPDLPQLLDGINELGIDQFEKLLFTTDGSTPSFYEQGLIDYMIKIAIDKGVPAEEAYLMASYYPARHYGIENSHGMIAPGRVAHLNILEDKQNPTPASVVAGGKWVLKNGEPVNEELFEMDLSPYGFDPLDINWDIDPEDDFQFSMPLGMEMQNSVIMRPYSVNFDVSCDTLPSDNDENFLLLIDRNGHWRVNTILKGFGTSVKGFASSYSNSGDIIVIGKDKEDMLAAFSRMKEIGGGMVLAENGGVAAEIPLQLLGGMSTEKMPELIEQHKMMTEELKKRGFPFSDPVYTCLFLSSTHLPYIRITPHGIHDVMKKTVLFPSIMR